MATLHARANGNLLDAATWGVVDSTSLLDSEANNTALTTSYVSSSTFTPGAITIDGIAVKVHSRNATPTGTMSVQLFDSTGAAPVAGTEVTINVSDIISATTPRVGWVFFLFPAPVLLLAATNYTVQAKTSSATQVNLFRNATANNWSRMLRTTTTGAPIAGDNMFIGGEWTAAATKTNRSVTMNETATTDYGGSSTTLAGLGISHGGTLAYGTTAATNYILRLSALLVVWEGGTLNIGTTGTPIPATSTAELQFDCVSDGDFGLICYGTMTAQAPSKTHHYALLNTDEAAAQTVLGVDRDLTTFWGSTDDVAIAPTTQTASHGEIRTLNAIGATTITVSSGLTNAHSGTSPTQAEVANLTRIITIRNTAASFAAPCAYTHFHGNATVDIDWVLFRGLGRSSDAEKQCVTISVTSGGSISLTGCVFRDMGSNAIVFHNNVAIGTVVVDACVFTGFPGISAGSATITIGSLVTSVVSATLNNNVHIHTDGSSSFIHVSHSNVTVTNNRAAGVAGTFGFHFDSVAPMNNVVSGNIAHSGATSGFEISGCRGLTLTNCTAWRCSSQGILVDQSANVTIDGATVFGSSGRNIGIDLSDSTNIRLRNVVSNGDTSFATAHGVFSTNAGAGGTFILENCNFGTAAGILVTHSTADVRLQPIGGTTGIVYWIFNNCIFASGTETDQASTIQLPGNILFLRHEGVAGTYRRQYPAIGTVARETTVVRTVGRASQKLTPSGATSFYRLHSEPYRVPVRSGEAITHGVWVRKDPSYTGSAPRLVLRSNAALGIDADVVLDTHTAAADTWERLTGTTTPVAEDDGVVEFVVECDGSAGNVYVADASATTS